MYVLGLFCLFSTSLLIFTSFISYLFNKKDGEWPGGTV
jgi:hypothetical protein